MTVEELNKMSDAEAADVLRACCGSSRWVEAMTAQRPFHSREDLFSAADKIWSDCGRQDWHEAFSHHPRIGAQVSGKEAVEQAGAQSATLSIKDQLAHVNRRYEERFGHIYIVCATGKSAEETSFMSTISTHVLDTSLGAPARGIRITLERGDEVISTAVTDVDGRAKDLSGGRQLGVGLHRLVFEVGQYFSSTAREGFYERITIEFVVSSESDHYHVPLLLSPFGYSTYRGS